NPPHACSARRQAAGARVANIINGANGRPTECHFELAPSFGHNRRDRDSGLGVREIRVSSVPGPSGDPHVKAHPVRTPKPGPRTSTENSSMPARLSWLVVIAAAVGPLCGPPRLMGDEPTRPTNSASEANPAVPAPGHSVHGEPFNDGPRQAAYLMAGMG